MMKKKILGALLLAVVFAAGAYATPTKSTRIFAQYTPSFAVTYSATPTFAPSSGGYQTITLTGNITSWTFTAGSDGELVTIAFRQDGSGNRTIAGTPGNVLLAGSALTLSTGANKVDMVTWRYDLGTTKWREVGRAMNQ